MGFKEAVDVDGEEITKETIGDVAEEVAEEMVECEAEAVVDTVTDKISEYEKIRAANVKQREKLLRQLKRNWQGYKKGEGFVTGGKQNGAKRVKVVGEEALLRDLEEGLARIQER